MWQSLLLWNHWCDAWFVFHLLSTRPVTFLVTSCSTFIYRSTLNLYTFFSTSSISIGNSIIILNFTSLSAIVAKTYRIYVHIKIIRIIKFCFHNFWSCGYILFFPSKDLTKKYFISIENFSKVIHSYSKPHIFDISHSLQMLQIWCLFA